MSWRDDIEERVVRAYQEHGLKAKPFSFRVEDGCCCGLGALLYSLKKDPARESFTGVGTELGMTRQEVEDFTDGFDRAMCGTSLEDLSDDGVIGHAVGKRVIREGLRAARRTTLIQNGQVVE